MFRGDFGDFIPPTASHADPGSPKWMGWLQRLGVSNFSMFYPWDWQMLEGLWFVWIWDLSSRICADYRWKLLEDIDGGAGTVWVSMSQYLRFSWNKFSVKCSAWFIMLRPSLFWVLFTILQLNRLKKQNHANAQLQKKLRMPWTCKESWTDANRVPHLANNT